MAALSAAPRPAGGGMGRIRARFLLAVALSMLVHIAMLAFVRLPPAPLRLAAPGPMVVDLQPAAPEHAIESPAPVPVPAPAPRPRLQRPAPIRRSVPPARPVTPPVITTPPLAHPSAPPPVDMMADVRARRAEREAREHAAAQEDASSGPAGSGRDASLAALNRNLGTLAGDDGTGGIFQILWKGSLSAEYAFNGWHSDSRRRWREVIEVRAGPDGDIERAIIRSMIALIRSHYGGDFLWESRRLGRVVTLSARPEENAGLEDFLYREFFGTPTLKAGSR